MRGRRYGRLTVTGQGSTHGQWLCSCECGQIKEINGSNLRAGRTQSCGCLRDERTRQAVGSHAMSGSRIYRQWSMMLDRCRNPRSQFFSRYGGRGIQVCDRWHKFEAFYADMGDRPAGKTLDRINNDGDYEPANCRWATPKEQCNNKALNRLLTLRGRTQTLSQWAIELGVNESTLRTRVGRGWSDERVLTQPVRSISAS